MSNQEQINCGISVNLNVKLESALIFHSNPALFLSNKADDQLASCGSTDSRACYRIVNTQFVCCIPIRFSIKWLQQSYKRLFELVSDCILQLESVGGHWERFSCSGFPLGR